MNNSQHRRHAIVARRTFVAGIAGAAIVATKALAATPASSGADPIFALIARHRAEYKAYGDAILAQEPSGRWRDADARVEQLCDSCQELGWAIASTIPTTMAGVAAVLSYANEFEDLGDEWPSTDDIGPEGWHYQLRQSTLRALQALC
jgi:hypothetical protein